MPHRQSVAVVAVGRNSTWSNRNRGQYPGSMGWCTHTVCSPAVSSARSTMHQWPPGARAAAVRAGERRPVRMAGALGSPSESVRYVWYSIHGPPSTRTRTRE